MIGRVYYLRSKAPQTKNPYQVFKKSMSESQVTDLSSMPFGAHKGKKMQDVPAQYLLWLYDNDTGLWCDKQRNQALKKYIEDSWDALLKDYPDYEPRHSPK